MNTTEIFLIALLIVFTAPYLLWRVMRTDHWAPLVVVQIVTGILLGPGVIGAAFPEYHRFVFNPAVAQSLNGIAWWAVMLFVWIAGLELDLRQAWQFVIGVGMACAVTALPILILLMDKLQILRQPLGQRILRYACLLAFALLAWAVRRLLQTKALIMIISANIRSTRPSSRARPSPRSC